MKPYILPVLLASTLFVAACDRAPEPGPGAATPPAAPPVAEQRPYEVVAPHGATRVDEYYWLRDDERTDSDMLAYLEAENAYADAVMAPLSGLREKLYEELVGRLKQDDMTVPYEKAGFWYYTRHEEGKEYPIHARRKGDMDADEEILLDVNALAEGHDYYNVGNWEVSPDGAKVAFLEDTVGRSQHQLRVRDLVTGDFHDTGIGGLSSSLVWGADSESLYFVENDPDTLLTKRVKLHRLGGDTEVLYHEPDDSFYVFVNKTRSERYVCVISYQTVSTEQRCLDMYEPAGLELVAERRRDFEYSADHLGDRWVVRTNWDAKNFRLMAFADGTWNDRDAWTDLLPHDEAVLVSGYTLFDDFVAVSERSGGLTRIRILHDDGSGEFVATDEDAYVLSRSVNAEPDTDWLRYTYTSLTTPTTWYELNVKTGERVTLKEEPVLGGFDKDDYTTGRLWATARDGTRVPVSVLHLKDIEPDGTAPMLVYGYGSYGASMEPWFNRNVISLVDRGVVYAIAHIRGGQEMGRHWYEDGKLLNKKNTFTDFIDVTDFLVEEGYAHPDRVAALGGSAGGLLVGAVANMAPDKYHVIVSLVPFVDIVTTMLDETIPLTTNEYDEWGNPADPEYYAYMLSYSPYDQLAAQDYPAMFVGTGLWDSQVQYWEPAKYVARLRASKTDDNTVVFRTQMEAGHGGRSGRFQRYHEIAEYYAFLLDRLGVR